MVKKIVIAALIILVVGTTYLFLGGGEKLEFKVEDKPAFYIAGSDYIGSYKGEELERIFFEARKKSKATQSDLVVLNYDNDSLRKGLIHQLIGIEYSNFPADSNSTEIVEMRSGKYIVTTIKAHNLVMPKPESVRNQAVRFAAALGLQPENVSIEIYHDERSLEILFPLKEL